MKSMNRFTVLICLISFISHVCFFPAMAQTQAQTAQTQPYLVPQNPKYRIPESAQSQPQPKIVHPMPKRPTPMQVYANPKCSSGKSDFEGKCLTEITPYKNTKCGGGISDRDGRCLDINDPLIAGNRPNVWAPAGSVSSGIDPIKKAKMIKDACKNAGTGVYESETGVLYKSCQDYMNEKIDRYETAKVDSFNQMQDQTWQRMEDMRKTALNAKVDSIKAASDSQYKTARNKVVIGVAVTAFMGCGALVACSQALTPASALVGAEACGAAFFSVLPFSVLNLLGTVISSYPGTSCFLLSTGTALSAMATRSAYMSMKKSVASSEELAVLATPTASLPKMVKSSEMSDPGNPFSELMNDPAIPKETKGQIASFNASLGKMQNQGMQIDFMNGNFTSNGKTYNATQLSQSKEYKPVNSLITEFSDKYQPTANRLLDQSDAQRSVASTNNNSNNGNTNNSNANFTLSNPNRAVSGAGEGSSSRSVNAINRMPSSFSGVEYFPVQQSPTVQYKNGELIHADPGPTADGKPALFSVGKPVMPIIERTTGFVQSAN